MRTLVEPPPSSQRNIFVFHDYSYESIYCLLRFLKVRPRNVIPNG
jgi:hypothetical protein